MKTFLIEEILSRLKEANNLTSDTQLSEFLGVSKATISNWKARKSLDYELLFSKCEHLNLDWLLTGYGSMLREINEEKKATATAAPEGQGIPLIPVEAFCGYGEMAFDIPIEDYYYVADLKNADFLIRAKGNSMYPKYSSGDLLACVKIQETLFFQWGKIYAIYTKSQGIMVKRVQQSKNEGYVLLVSDNERYKPFDVPESDIVAIALVVGAIRVE